MVELLRPTLRGEPLDFSEINKRNTQVSKGRDFAGFSFTDEGGVGPSKSSIAADKVRATNTARSQQLDRLSGGNIVAGSISKAPTRASQQKQLDVSLKDNNRGQR